MLGVRLCPDVHSPLPENITDKGYHGNVVVPTRIFSARRRQVKIDYIDIVQLMQFYTNGLFTLISIPDFAQETDRI